MHYNVRRRGGSFLFPERCCAFCISIQNILRPKKRKFSFLFLCGLSPSTIYGDRLKISAKGSPRLIIHCLRPCQKRLDISQVQNKQTFLRNWTNCEAHLFKTIFVLKGNHAKKEGCNCIEDR